MKNQSDEKSKMEKERNELEIRLKQKIEKLESEKNQQKKMFQSEVVRSENEFNHKS